MNRRVVYAAALTGLFVSGPALAQDANKQDQNDPLAAVQDIFSERSSTLVEDMIEQRTRALAAQEEIERQRREVEAMQVQAERLETAQRIKELELEGEVAGIQHKVALNQAQVELTRTELEQAKVLDQIEEREAEKKAEEEARKAAEEAAKRAAEAPAVEVPVAVPQVPVWQSNPGYMGGAPQPSAPAEPPQVEYKVVSIQGVGSDLEAVLVGENDEVIRVKSGAKVKSGERVEIESGQVVLKNDDGEERILDIQRSLSVN